MRGVGVSIEQGVKREWEDRSESFELIHGFYLDGNTPFLAVESSSAPIADLVDLKSKLREWATSDHVGGPGTSTSRTSLVFAVDGTDLRFVGYEDGESFAVRCYLDELVMTIVGRRWSFQRDLITISSLEEYFRGRRRIVL